MMIQTVSALMLAALVLSACGMNSAVGVLPNTLDRLGDQSEASRDGASAPIQDGRIKP